MVDMYKKMIDWYIYTFVSFNNKFISWPQERIDGEPLKVKVMLPDRQDLSSVLESEGYAIQEDSLLELMLQSQEIEAVLKVLC